jgi:hypothetical protein
MKQTPIDFLLEKILYHYDINLIGDIFVEQANEMHKEQLADAWYAGDEDGPIHEFEDYYQETFKIN